MLISFPTAATNGPENSEQTSCLANDDFKKKKHHYFGMQENKQ
jgi:hypothetical protein